MQRNLALMFTFLSILSMLPVSQSGAVSSNATSPTPLTSAASAFSEDFSTLNEERWAVSNKRGFWKGAELTGKFNPRNVQVQNGFLILTLNVQACRTGLCAQAAEISTREPLGFGRYSVRMRTASTSNHPQHTGQARPGNISAAFNYVADSQTEIDFEIEGHRPQTLNTAVWNTTAQHSNERQQVLTDLSQGFHTYTWEWTPERITFTLDGQPLRETTQHIPQTPAPLHLNLWPTLNPNWGGLTQEGTVYMLVDSVTYEAL